MHPRTGPERPGVAMADADQPTPQQDAALELHGAELDEHIMGGLRWVTIACVALEIASGATTVILARLVSPAEYGRAVIALIVPVLASILTYEGFGTPLVLQRQVERADLESATGVSLLVGVALSCLVLVFALTLAGPVFGSHMEPLFEMTAPAFVIFAAGVVPRAMLSRRLQWRRMNGSDVGGALVTALVSTVLAAMSMGASAIVLGALCGGVATTALLWLGERPVLPRLHRGRVRPILRVGVSAAAAGVAMTIRRNIDYVMLATRLSPHLVGIYWRGFSLGVDQQSKISGVTTRVAVSILPRTDRGDDLRAARRSLVRMNTLVIFPLLGILVATAPWFVPTVYGHQWADAVVPTQILAAGGMVWATLAGMEGVLLAAGAPASLAIFNVISLVTVGTVAYLAARLGVVSVAVAMAGLEVLTLAGAQYFLLYKRARIRPRDGFGDLLPAAIATGIMVAVAAPVASAVSDVVHPLLVVAITGAFGLLLYGVIVWKLFPSSWAMLAALARAAGIERLMGAMKRERPAPAEAGQPMATVVELPVRNRVGVAADVTHAGPRVKVAAPRAR